MSQSRPDAPLAFNIQRGGMTYSATYKVQSGRVSVAYLDEKSRRFEKSAKVGGDEVTTARILLRELIADAAQLCK
jgi:hypothetical protein